MSMRNTSTYNIFCGSSWMASQSFLLSFSFPSELILQHINERHGEKGDRLILLCVYSAVSRCLCDLGGGGLVRFLFLFLMGFEVWQVVSCPFSVCFFAYSRADVSSKLRMFFPLLRVSGFSFSKDRADTPTGWQMANQERGL
ncbi:hypothetical protein B0T26DRAFT_160158 [Lasiosphaeria miniovina]|uniref:Uncharacterized protein n=1 Tax=Lasiosphaeria miniovina TaxID=1954250 RepID=A0AA40E4S2_9PEZI|nr:uncharacterized protein B0T26DRAFT_160158 [Lasiosphaeria miniovina]KAK0728149.1 hypothetical protein B0T26DRAFT_160158 [Lasiosphaeria miniovina]